MNELYIINYNRTRHYNDEILKIRCSTSVFNKNQCKTIKSGKIIRTGQFPPLIEARYPHKD